MIGRCWHAAIVTTAIFSFAFSMLMCALLLLSYRYCPTVLIFHSGLTRSGSYTHHEAVFCIVQGQWQGGYSHEAVGDPAVVPAGARWRIVRLPPGTKWQCLLSPVSPPSNYTWKTNAIGIFYTFVLHFVSTSHCMTVSTATRPLILLSIGRIAGWQ
jgi:hypothetical protein